MNRIKQPRHGLLVVLWRDRVMIFAEVLFALLNDFKSMAMADLECLLAGFYYLKLWPLNC